jgi:hypothetical protein
VKRVAAFDFIMTSWKDSRPENQMTGEQGKAAMLWILAATKDDVQKVTDALEKAFENAPYPVSVMTEKHPRAAVAEPALRGGGAPDSLARADQRPGPDGGQDDGPADERPG